MASPIVELLRAQSRVFDGLASVTQERIEGILDQCDEASRKGKWEIIVASLKPEDREILDQMGLRIVSRRDGVLISWAV